MSELYPWRSDMGRRLHTPWGEPVDGDTLRVAICAGCGVYLGIEDIDRIRSEHLDLGDHRGIAYINVVHEARVRELEAEVERLRAFAFGDAPEWEKANCSLKHRVRELEAEVERLRSPYQAFTAERRVTELEAERDELRELCSGFADAAEDARGHYGIEECAGPGQPATEWDDIQERLSNLARDARNALHSPAGPSTDEDKP